MAIQQAAVLEPNMARYRALAEGVKKAGLRVSAARHPEELQREQLVIVGPTLPKPAQRAKDIRRKLSSALVLAAQTKGFKAAWADAILPLPISVADFKVRLAEWNRKPQPKELHDAGSGLLDSTTQFYAFAHFKEVLYIEIKRARRYGFPLALGLMTFDTPKAAVGGALHEQLMAGLALAIRRSLRDTDYPVQYSPERILVLMPHTDLAGSLIVARRILERVGKATFYASDLQLTPTLSIGVAAGDPGREYSFSDLAKQAQDGLLEAIAQGGNRVEFVTAVATRSPHAETPLPPPPRF